MTDARADINVQRQQAHDPVNDRQPQSEAFLLAARRIADLAEFLENCRTRLLPDTNAGVLGLPEPAAPP